MVEKDKQDTATTNWKNISVEEEVYDEIVKWADVQHRTIGGQIKAMLEVYRGERKPKD